MPKGNCVLLPLVGGPYCFKLVPYKHQKEHEFYAHTVAEPQFKFSMQYLSKGSRQDNKVVVDDTTMICGYSFVRMSVSSKFAREPCNMQIEQMEFDQAVIPVMINTKPSNKHEELIKPDPQMVKFDAKEQEDATETVSEPVTDSKDNVKKPPKRRKTQAV